jgi:biopolymer transport protein ExbB/TolQ
LGTVLGVIISFHALGDAGQNTGAMGGVMAGIAEALVSTGVGLFVALPAVVAYNAIQKRIGEIESSALSLTKLLTAYVRAADRAEKSGTLPTIADGAKRDSAANLGREEDLDNDTLATFAGGAE